MRLKFLNFNMAAAIWDLNLIENEAHIHSILAEAGSCSKLLITTELLILSHACSWALASWVGTFRQNTIYESKGRQHHFHGNNNTNSVFVCF